MVVGYGTDYRTELNRVVFQLVGLASDLRETSGRWIAQCYDAIAARLKIDDLNERQIGPYLSFESAAELAVGFVDRRQHAIKNIGLALLDAREMDHHAVELFGECGYESTEPQRSGADRQRYDVDHLFDRRAR
jgi:hypothetical protein